MDSRPGIIQNLTLHLKDEVINIDVEENAISNAK